MTEFLQIAHRFYAGLYPENSFQSMQACFNSAVKAAEVDIQLSKDGVPILLHDSILDRTSNLTGPVSEWNWIDLQQHCQLKDDGTLVSLEQVLSVFQNQPTTLFLEIKSLLAIPPVCELIERFNAIDQVIISSFHHHLVVDAKLRLPSILTMALFEANPVDPVHIINSCHADMAGVGIESADRSLVERLTEYDIPCYTYTLKKPADLVRAKAIGMAGGFVDMPL